MVLGKSLESHAKSIVIRFYLNFPVNYQSEICLVLYIVLYIVLYMYAVYYKKNLLFILSVT